MASAKKKTPTATVVDIDAADQQSRAEDEASNRPAPVVRFKGEMYNLVPEIPIDVIVALADINEDEDDAASARLVVRTTRSLFDEGEWDRFMAAKPTMKNLMQVFDLAFSAYGPSLGESEASEESSDTTGTPARQPSKRGTASS